MPKMKTHRGTAKRVKLTGSGKVKRHHAFCRHLLGAKSMKRKRKLRQSVVMAQADAKVIKKMLPYA